MLIKFWISSACFLFSIPYSNRLKWAPMVMTTLISSTLSLFSISNSNNLKWAKVSAPARKELNIAEINTIFSSTKFYSLDSQFTFLFKRTTNFTNPLVQFAKNLDQAEESQKNHTFNEPEYLISNVSDFS